MSEQRNVETVQAYLKAIESFDVETASAILDVDVVQTEHPNKLYAKGQVRGREVMMRDLPKGQQVLRKQAYPIETILAAGDKVVVETRWEGIVNVPLGRLKPGDAMVAHIAMIFTLRDGRIVAQKNYDCYEDFAAA
jgi:ketosteroid isomerase-like protein